MTASSQEDGLWSFLEQKKANHHNPNSLLGSCSISGSTSSSLRMEREPSRQGQSMPDSLNLTDLHHGEMSRQCDHTVNPSSVGLRSLPSDGKVCFVSPVTEEAVSASSVHTRRPPPATNSVAVSGEEFPGGSALRPSHKQPPFNMGALQKVEKTAQEIAASTSAAVQRLAQHDQVDLHDQHDPCAAYGLNDAGGPSPHHSSCLESSAITLPDHQRHLCMSSLPAQNRETVAFDMSRREGGLDLGAVEMAQLMARRVAQSTGDAVEKLSQSLAPPLVTLPTNTT